MTSNITSCVNTCGEIQAMCWESDSDNLCFRIQEYLADGTQEAQEKMSRKLEQNLIDVENMRRARQLSSVH